MEFVKIWHYRKGDKNDSPVTSCSLSWTIWSLHKGVPTHQVGLERIADTASSRYT